MANGRGWMQGRDGIWEALITIGLVTVVGFMGVATVRMIIEFIAER